MQVFHVVRLLGNLELFKVRLFSFYHSQLEHKENILCWDTEKSIICNVSGEVKECPLFSIFATFFFQLFFLLTFNKLFWLLQKAGKIAENSSAEIEFRCWLSSVCKCPNPKSSCVGWLEFFTHFPAFFVFLPICNFPHFLNVKKNYKIGGKFKLPKS